MVKAKQIKGGELERLELIQALQLAARIATDRGNQDVARHLEEQIDQVLEQLRIEFQDDAVPQ